MLVNSEFPGSEYNLKKNATLTRRSMQCLQQWNNIRESGCWLNDEVIHIIFYKMHVSSHNILYRLLMHIVDLLPRTRICQRYDV